MRETPFRSVLDGALDAVIATDLSGAVIEWNPAAESLLGWSRDEAVGRALEELILPARGRFARLLQQPRGVPVECTVVHRDGHEIHVEAGIGSAESVVTAFIRDISERKRAERLRETEHRITRLLATAPPGRELAAAAQPILGEGLGWAAVEGYLLDGDSLRLVARWGTE